MLNRIDIDVPWRMELLVGDGGWDLDKWKFNGNRSAKESEGKPVRKAEAKGKTSNRGPDPRQERAGAETRRERIHTGNVRWVRPFQQTKPSTAAAAMAGLISARPSHKAT